MDTSHTVRKRSHHAVVMSLVLRFVTAGSMSGSRREVPASDETASMLRQLAVIADVRKVLGACSSRVLTVVQSFRAMQSGVFCSRVVHSMNSQGYSHDRLSRGTRSGGIRGHSKRVLKGYSCSSQARATGR